MKTAVGLIPSRLESTRLPNKALLDLCGVPLIVRTMRQAQQAKLLDAVFVCTDSERIANVVHRHGGAVIYTASTHQNGTTRIAEAKEKLEAAGSFFDLYVDVQGDEPLIDPVNIDAVVTAHLCKPEADVLLPYLPIQLEEALSPNVVKVVAGGSGRVTYLSRSLVPMNFRSTPQFWRKHLSVVSFTGHGLSTYASLPHDRSPLEDCEGIELLRAIEHGMLVCTIELTGDSISVDVQADYDKVHARIRRLEGG